MTPNPIHPLAVSGTDILPWAAVALLAAAVALLALLVRRRPQALLRRLEERLLSLQQQQQRLEAVFKDELSRGRMERAEGERRGREEIAGALKRFGDSLLGRQAEHARLQARHLEAFAKHLVGLTRLNEQKLSEVRRAVEGQLETIREDTGRQLERMRAVVDEQLQSALERRLSEAFGQVGERLERVYEGLGEMRRLAAGVGDLKKVLTNVKARGVWGEISLGRLLEQVLTPEQYAVNVATAGDGGERVEFAVRLPGRGREGGAAVWLPIDAKFPQEDYQRLAAAQEAADRQAAERAARALEQRVKAEARRIREKYIAPPATTDFGIMYLPTEGLYAEVLRRPGLCEALQREQRVVVAGPTTLAALLNSLQMGFRTLAIEQRSSEVWELLGGVKSEFAKFGAALEKTRKKLQEAANTIDGAQVRTRAIERRLRRVQQLPADSGDRRPQS